jgi:magnesium chelatase accessory protein
LSAASGRSKVERVAVALSWKRDAHNWPNSEASRFVQAEGLRWHVQEMGSGPVVLLVHGTGASTHSWRDLAPLLARDFTIIAPDLPGHGFTTMPTRRLLTLSGMARGLHELLRVLGLEPVLAIGHSAGAAIVIRMTLDGLLHANGLVSLNGAFWPFRGPASQFFSPLAKLLVRNPLVPQLFAWRASDRSAVERLIRATGSKLDRTGVDLYQRLISSPGHVAAALGMMANWDLAPLVRDLPQLGPQLILVAGGNDRTIPSEQSFRVRDKLPSARVEYLRGLGHLAHEERPEDIAKIVRRLAGSLNVLPEL